MKKLMIASIGGIVAATSGAEDFAGEPVTFLENAGWCWFQDPRALIVGDKLVAGGVEGAGGGSVVAGVYDLAGERHVGRVVLHADFQRNDHNAPAFHLRPDGSLLAVYAKHAEEPYHYYRISRPGDFLDWGPVQKHINLRMQANELKPAGVTYMNLMHLPVEGRLYNFFRDQPSYNPFYIYSEDHGNTWTGRTHLIDDNTKGWQRPYARYARKDESTIGVTFTEAHPRDRGTSIYYAEFRDGKFFTPAGRPVKALADGPLTPQEAELIYQGSGPKPEGIKADPPGSAWTSSVAYDLDGHPHIAYSLHLDDDDHRYRLASWDGKQWHDREIAYGGSRLYSGENSYTGLVALDPSHPSLVVISTDVHPSTGERAGNHEIYYARIGPRDHVATITWHALTTTDSAKTNIRPVIVRDSPYVAILWMRGEYRSFRNYDCDIVGFVFGEEGPKPEK